MEALTLLGWWGGGGGGGNLPALSLNINNFFNIETSATKLVDFFKK